MEAVGQTLWVKPDGKHEGGDEKGTYGWNLRVEPKGRT